MKNPPKKKAPKVYVHKECLANLGTKAASSSECEIPQGATTSSYSSNYVKSRTCEVTTPDRSVSAISFFFFPPKISVGGHQQWSNAKWPNADRLLLRPWSCFCTSCFTGQWARCAKVAADVWEERYRFEECTAYAVDRDLVKQCTKLEDWPLMCGYRSCNERLNLCDSRKGEFCKECKAPVHSDSLKVVGCGKSAHKSLLCLKCAAYLVVRLAYKNRSWPHIN